MGDRRARYRSGAYADISRIADYGAVSAELAGLSDRRIAALLDEASPIGTGIGGTAVRLDIEGTPVFAKRVALTDVERRPENVMSTANVFGLPTFCHYGLGSAGGGVWRELAAHTMTTKWVLERRTESFPLMYHWRVLPSMPTSVPDDLASIVAFWDSSLAVRERLKAIASSTASVVLFCEYIPANLHDWLTAQVVSGDDALSAACDMVERHLHAGVSFMSHNDLLHFDAHFRNIVADGHRLYFTDFGLATSPRFELSATEREFVDIHRSHDACYTVTEFVNWLVTAVAGVAIWPDRIDYIRRCAQGDDPENVPEFVAAIINRHAAVAVVMNEFYWKLHHESRRTPFPREQLRLAESR